MNNPRIYGNTPYTVAIIHGGPGAPGDVAPVAKELSATYGILEPLQTSLSIAGQIHELYTILMGHGSLPITLIGHSWGAWLSYLFAAKYPSLVRKLILISSGPFEEKYARDLTKTRYSRLTEEERIQIQTLEKLLSKHSVTDKKEIFMQFEKLISKADVYDPLLYESEVIEFQPDVYESIWNEASNLRKKGKLLQTGKQIQCSVVAIHGDYDPHPYEGVKSPLSRIIKDFHFILLAKCGHYPWLERNAKDKFYEIVNEELKSAIQ
jgi:pimeloyl-ACP methyl ester carboxylesterase